MSLLPTVLLVTMAVFAVGLYVWGRPRLSPAGATLSWHCPGCGKRLRQAANRAGRAVRCPGCNRSLTVPDFPPATLAPGPQREGYRVQRKPLPRQAADPPAG